MSQHGSRGNSLRGARAAQEALSEIRLRADSSWHGGNKYDRAFDTEAPETDKPDSSVRAGRPRRSEEAEAPSEPHPKPEEFGQTDYKETPTKHENNIWRCPPQQALFRYFRKWRGHRGKADDVPTAETLFLSTLGAFLGILAITGLNQYTLPHDGLDESIPSFGASAVLIYAVFDQSPLSQPRNFVGGQILSAAVGCAFRLAFGPRLFWLSAPLAMSMSLLLMQLTRTTHPPGGATAFVAATRPTLLPSHGFRFMGGILIGSLVMLLVALIVDNFHHTKAYPKAWFGLRWPERWWP